MFPVNNSQCDAFALSETWLTSNVDFNFHDFNIIRLDRDTPYGEVLLGMKKCCSFYRINLPPMPCIEAVACQIRIKGKDLCIASIYVPPWATAALRYCGTAS